MYGYEWQDKTAWAVWKMQGHTHFSSEGQSKKENARSETWILQTRVLLVNTLTHRAIAKELRV